MSTHDKKRYATVYGRMVQFFVRPAPKGKNKYREPVSVGIEWFKNKAQALAAADGWTE